MSAAAVNGLVVLVTALLFIAIVRALTWPPSRWLYLKPEAQQALRERADQFQNELREDAAASPRADKRKKVIKRDIKAEYYRRRNWPRVLVILRRAAGGIIFALAVLVVAVLALPFLAGPFPVVAGTAGYAGPPLAAFGLVVAATKFLDKPDARRDALPVPAGRQRSGLALDPAGEGSDPVTSALERYRERVTGAALKHARSKAARERGRSEGISEEEIAKAWESLVIPRLDAPAQSAVRSRGAWIVSIVAVPVVAVLIYLIFVLAIPKLPLGELWRVVVVAASILILYGLMRAIVGAWRRRDIWLGKITGLRGLAFGRQGESRWRRGVLMNQEPGQGGPTEGGAPDLGAQALPTQAAITSSPTAEQLALEAGWTMAVLYGKTEPIPTGEATGLPTANELQPADRRKLESDRLRHLLQRLAAIPEFAGSGLRTEVPAFDWDEAFWEEALRKLNLDILYALAVTRQKARLAYELGRWLRDTANPPDQHPPTLAPSRVFARDRIATIQGWLAELSSDLPPRAAAVVAASLGRWSEFAAVTASTSSVRLKNGDRTQLAGTLYKYLLRQGDLWLMLLTGADSASGLLSPEGYVAAGELALRRSAAMFRRILQRSWPALLAVAVALGAVLYLAITYLGGAAKVWTSIAAIAGSLGITAWAVASAVTRLTAKAERPVFATAEEDVMAWAITTMPPLRLGPRKVRQLRRAGIAPTNSLGRI